MKPHWIVLGLCLGLIGCFGRGAQRFQSAEENDGRDTEVRTIGDVTEVATQEEIPVVGVGLVVQLNGTGGGPPPAGGYRERLEHELKKRNVGDVGSLLKSPNNTMVIVTARIPAGTRKNDLIDVEVGLPESSRCTSLKGGYLISCELFNYDSSRNINPNSQSPERTFLGYPVVKAEGPVITGLTGRVRVADQREPDSGDSTRNEDESLKFGKVWSGGKCQIDPPIMLVMRENQQFSRVAAQVADRINQTFPSSMQNRDGIASAKNKTMVALGVPLQYRHDLQHYLLVVRAIPLDRSPPPDGPYRRQLAENLLDPVKCQAAAIRLEALGEESVPALRQALSASLPISRFAAAKALTYLRKRDGVDELSRLARQHAILRAPSLTALASLDESICHTRLAEMMSDADPEVRYGAFCGLRRLDDRSPEIACEKCKDAFTIHTVAPESTPMVHYLTGHRTEIVLFGKTPTLLPGMRVATGDDFTVATDDDGKVTIKRFSLKEKRVVERQCGAPLTEVFKTLAELGGSYTDAVDLLNKAHANHKLSCDVYQDALPRAVEPSVLARLAKDDPTLRNVPLLPSN